MLGAKWMDEIEDQRKLGMCQREEENKFKINEDKESSQSFLILIYKGSSCKEAS